MKAGIWVGANVARAGVMEAGIMVCEERKLYLFFVERL